MESLVRDDETAIQNSTRVIHEDCRVLPLGYARSLRNIAPGNTNRTVKGSVESRCDGQDDVGRAVGGHAR